jgi:NitT/TauT family transport system substrate-binding protein
MEIYQIKVFLEVARHLSFTEAADALALTQPAVSAKIKSLESEIKAPLFYRMGRKIALTRVGKYLFE